MDTEERRSRGEPVVGAAGEMVPEDILGERDLEARLCDEDLRQRLAEGRPPAEPEPDH